MEAIIFGFVMGALCFLAGYETRKYSQKQRLKPFISLSEKEFDLLVSGLPCVVDGTHIILKDIGFEKMRELIDKSEANPELYLHEYGTH